ncbi:ATP-binding cassette domain-containing protein [Salmonella enterica subsp. enterica serovar Elomrane]|uniref:ATP-binding cassette domain-containing protein n=1 Tax=Salmonella enterica TaxID=28901 RepID=A0A765INZ4_SALER|nr:ATP-binding cassette domain-containing protein [Salmonella enterica]EAA7370241.1 ATP-binding cassette domain-containing protein [Salmonella enterica subsp. enterica]ECF3579067.1 ATP-binding cassette domain-containing protein [Salmonella enterica subsp. enterica serovar Agama]ECJ6070424.1 ATP-binding cassette domain-containing protein [Salmonella enterica subsp. enterica serovar Cubana]EDN3607980.1 ATP-binding cassette domain-containing protein [Salmonella enterica subsp. enterica serovar Oua
MLSLQQVTLESARYRWYGARRWSPLLQNVSFDIAPGEMVALVGGSGEGKSLLLQCLLDLLPENLRFRGEITLDGNRLDRHTIRQLRGNTFSYVPQGVQALNPMLNIRKHLNRACHLTGRAWDETQMVQLLQQSDLEPTVLERFPRQLSGGMAKRILACHASLSQARYIFADEITAWLDTALANQLLEHLRGLCERGCGVLWVTHDLLLAARYADRIVALHQGYITDNIRCEQLQPEEMSEPLKRQWQALPELNPLFMPTGEGIEC